MNREDPFERALTPHGCAIESGMTLNAKPRELDGADEAKQWLGDLLSRQASGWAQFSDANVWVTDGATSASPDGILLAAELYLASSKESHHLRHNGEKWIAATITREKSTENDVLETRSLLADETKELRYEVAWTGKDDGPLCPVAFRLIASP